MQAVRRLQDKTEAAKALALLPTRQKRPTIEAKETPTSSSLLVPIDRISGSRGDTPTDRHTRARAHTHTHTNAHPGGNLGLNHIPQFGSGELRQGGGEVEEDEDGVWVSE
jgi:hypothetical protein